MNSFKKISSLTTLFALLLTFSFSSVFAQETKVKAQPETYTLSGEVVDWESGEAVADAQVVVMGQTNLTATTNAEGMFTLEGLEAGTYTIAVKGDGYQTWKQEVTVEADKEIKVKLKPQIK